MLGRIVTVVVPALLWLSPLPAEAEIKSALVVASFMVVAWITKAFEYVLTGFMGCYLFWALDVVSFETAFGGFASEAPWFVFGAVMLGMTVTTSGLGRRLAFLVLARLGTSYSRILLGFTVVSFLLTLVVPSGSACVIIKATVALGLMQAFGLGPGSNIGRAVFLLLTYTASLFNKMVIAGSSSILVHGLVKSLAQMEVLWSRWLLAFLPCIVATGIVVWRLSLWLFPAEKQLTLESRSFFADELTRMGAWTPPEKRAGLLILIGVGLWTTDFLHHISPAVIGLGVGLAAALPYIGVLQAKDFKRMDYTPVFFVATALSLGKVLVKVGAIDILTGALFSWMDALITNNLTMAIVAYWTAFTYHFFLGSEVAMLSTSIPPLIHFAQSRGFNPLAVSMLWTLAGASKIFVYQSSVLILGYSYGYFEGRDLLRFGAWMTVIEFVIIVLLVTCYWPLIGLL
ncbi:MAG: SLC13 family permease [Acidobacteriota bacterium]